MLKFHLGGTAKFYDPMCKSTILDGQIHDFDVFLDACDLIVVMIGHEHIRKNADKLAGLLVLDTRNICELPNAYKL